MNSRRSRWAGSVRWRSLSDVQPPVWLISYDPGGVWPPVRALFEARVSIGERDDYWWVALSAPIPISPERGGSPKGVDRAILGARHVGGDVLATAAGAQHVYIVCPNDPKAASANRDRLTVEEVTVARWGIVYATKAQAERGSLA